MSTTALAAPEPPEPDRPDDPYTELDPAAAAIIERQLRAAGEQYRRALGEQARSALEPVVAAILGLTSEVRRGFEAMQPVELEPVDGAPSHADLAASYITATNTAVDLRDRLAHARCALAEAQMHYEQTDPSERPDCIICGSNHLAEIADALAAAREPTRLEPETEAELREHLTTALLAEHQQRAEQQIVATPEEHCAALAEAALPLFGFALDSWHKAHTRAAQAEDLLEAAHQSSNAAEAVRARAVPILRRALERLPETCSYHGDRIDGNRNSLLWAEACCDTGIPAVRRRRALEALASLTTTKET